MTKLKILLMNTAQNHKAVVMILTLIHQHLIPHPEVEEEEEEEESDNQQGDEAEVGAEVVQVLSRQQLHQQPLMAPKATMIQTKPISCLNSPQDVCQGYI